MSEPARRPLWIVVLGLALAAVGLWVSSRLTWTTELRRHAGTDATTLVATTGADTAALVPLAVLALAGVAATVAVGGWARRTVGVVLILAGAVAVFFGVAAGPDSATDFVPWGRIIAVAAGVELLLAGAMLVALGNRLPRLGAAYQTPGAARPSTDPDADLWRSLSLGEDPTTGDR